MVQTRRPKAAFDSALEAALASSQPGVVDWRARLRRGRRQESWTPWLTSAVIHAALVLVLTAMLMPLRLGQSGALIVETLLEPEQTPLETFTISADDETAESETVAETAFAQLADGALEAIPHPLAGGAASGGARRWKETSTGYGGSSDGPSGPQANFFGTVAYGDRFVFVLDISGSMNCGARGSPRQGCRFRRACEELLYSIDRLTKDQSFYVVLFSDRTLRMFDSQSVLPQMLPATPENKARLRAWLASVEPGGGTDPREALRLGLSLKPSAVFLLSDGEFNGRKQGLNNGVFSGNPTVSEIVERSNPGHSPIHTFAYEDPVNRGNMLNLSTQTGGAYRYIPPARGAEKPQPRAASPRRPKLDPPTQTPAQRAGTLLHLAKTLESAGKTEKASRRYRDILHKFPNTHAAIEARLLLQRRRLP